MASDSPVPASCLTGAVIVERYGGNVFERSFKALH